MIWFHSAERQSTPQGSSRPGLCAAEPRDTLDPLRVLERNALQLGSEEMPQGVTGRQAHPGATRIGPGREDATLEVGEPEQAPTSWLHLGRQGIQASERVGIALLDARDLISEPTQRQAAAIDEGDGEVAPRDDRMQAMTVMDVASGTNVSVHNAKTLAVPAESST